MTLGVAKLGTTQLTNQAMIDNQNAVKVERDGTNSKAIIRGKLNDLTAFESSAEGQ